MNLKFKCVNNQNIYRTVSEKSKSLSNCRLLSRCNLGVKKIYAKKIV